MVRRQIGNADSFGPFSQVLFDQLNRHQLIVNDEIGLAQAFDGTQRQQSGMSRAGSNKVYKR